MDCRKIKEDLKAYIDGELTAEVAGEMRRHIDYCEECGRDYESASAFDGTLKNIFSACQSKGRADFINSLPAYTNGKIRSGKTFSIFRLGAAAMLALAVGVAIFMATRAPVHGFQVESGDALLDNQSEIRNLSTVARLNAGQHFNVLSTKPLSVRSEGGSVIKLDPSTEARVRSAGDFQLALELISGRIHVQSSDKDSFAIHTTGGVAEFTGGECRVEKERDTEPVVSVFRGAARLSNSHGNITCDAGRIASLPSQKAPEFTARSIVPPGVLKRELKIFKHLTLAGFSPAADQERIIRTLQEWNDFWNVIQPDEKLPAVNFATEMVVFSARKGNAVVRISSVSEIGKQLSVTVSTGKISKDSANYDLVIVEKSDFPEYWTTSGE